MILHSQQGDLFCHQEEFHFSLVMFRSMGGTSFHQLLSPFLFSMVKREEIVFCNHG